MNRTHGLSDTREYIARKNALRTPEYNAYYGARQRCMNPRNPRYGGRGIQFRFSSFEEFFRVLGPRPSPLYSVDRIDNNGHYEVGNVRWATRVEQARNRRPTIEWTLTPKQRSDRARKAGRASQALRRAK